MPQEREIRIGGQQPQLDDTDKPAVSAYGKSTAAGDTALLVDSDGHLQVDIKTITAGTTAIGKLAANSGVDIGDVTLTANTDGTYIGDIKFGEALVAGENVIGLVGSNGISISQTPTVTAGAYSANDAVGGLLTFANAARATGYGGVIKDVIFLDDAGQDAALELWLFNATFTAMTDNAAWAPSQADLRKLVAVISSTSGTWRAAGTPSANVVEVSQRYDATGTSLFGQLVTRGTPTFAATDDVTVIIGLLQD